MSLSSTLFLFLLFPMLVLGLYLGQRISNKNIKRILVILANSIFYIWGGVSMFFFVLVMIILLWIGIVVLQKSNRKYLFVCIILITLLPLCICKYLPSLEYLINSIFHTGFQNSNYLISITGLSFFTFQALSLEIDIWRNKVTKSLTLSEVYCYLLFFPTIVSGPIIKFNEFDDWLSDYRGISFLHISEGFERISIGLAKKYLIADKLIPIVEFYFDGIKTGANLSTIGLWIGSIAYSLQLYFDFSGYSDIAIGVSHIIGYDIPENFKTPYLSVGISEFWRRWHISLGAWFKDYVYIPLGGNRCDTFRCTINLLVVWILTGMWHGSTWTFIVWGIGHFLLIICEKYCKKMGRFLSKRNLLGRIYTLFFVNLLWIIFRADSIKSAWKYISGMFSVKNMNSIEEKAIYFIPFIIITLLLCLVLPPLRNMLNTFIADNTKKENTVMYLCIVRKIVVLIILIFAVFAIFNASYTPYIYGKF